MAPALLPTRSRAARSSISFSAPAGAISPRPSRCSTSEGGMNTGVIDRFTEVFTRYIDSGFGLLGGEVAFLASTLIVIDVTLAGLFWAWGADEDVLAHLVKKTLFVGFFAFLIGNFNGLAKIVFYSFAGLGLKASGSGLSADQFLQPGRLAQVGIDAGRPILQAASSLLGYVSFFQNFVQIFVLLVAWLIVLVAFFILATADAVPSSVGPLRPHS